MHSIQIKEDKAALQVEKDKLAIQQENHQVVVNKFELQIKEEKTALKSQQLAFQSQQDQFNAQQMAFQLQKEQFRIEMDKQRLGFQQQRHQLRIDNELPTISYLDQTEVGEVGAPHLTHFNPEQLLQPSPEELLADGLAEFEQAKQGDITRFELIQRQYEQLNQHETDLNKLHKKLVKYSQQFDQREIDNKDLEPDLAESQETCDELQQALLECESLVQWALYVHRQHQRDQSLLQSSQNQTKKRPKEQYKDSF